MSTSPPEKANPGWLPHRELAALRRSLASAEDAQITRLVAMVDGLSERGMVDDLVAPFRGRLAELRPARPLRFARLLFSPLDPLIVPAPRWRPDAPSLPRTALPALAESAHDTIGAEAARVDAMIDGRSTRDSQVIAAAGALLWPCAAQALLRSPMPAGWTQQTGLGPDMFGQLAANTAAMLDQALSLQALRAESEVGIPPSGGTLQTMLKQVSAARPQALGLLVALVLARLPEAAATLRQVGSELGGAAAVSVRAAAEQAKASLLERLEADGGAEALVVGTELGEAGAEVRRIALLLQGMESGAPGVAARIAELRQRLDVSCRTRFWTGLRVEFVKSLEALVSEADDQAVMRLEAAARGLRALGTEGRRFGSPEVYDLLLRQTTDAVKAIPAGGALTQSDKVRLVEILAGPDEAWTLLEQASGKGAGR